MAECGAPIERKTVREHFTSWLKAFESEQSEGTFIRYEGIVDNFLSFLDGKASRNLSALTADDVERYRDHMQGQVAPSTVNTHLKVIRVALERAVKQRVFETNPARLVDNLSTEGRHKRRAFTQAEFKKLLAVCEERLDHRSHRRHLLRFEIWAIFIPHLGEPGLAAAGVDHPTQKTGRVQILPLAKPLLRHIETLPAGDDPRRRSAHRSKARA